MPDCSTGQGTLPAAIEIYPATSANPLLGGAAGQKFVDATHHNLPEI